MINLNKILVSSVLLSALGACGGGSEDGKPIEPLPQTTTFSMDISDAPVDALSQVVVCFNGIELTQPLEKTVYEVGQTSEMLTANDLCRDEQDQVVPNTVGINLLDYMGSDSIEFIDQLVIEPAEYSQMRLLIATGSYAVVEETGEQVPISVPSNELKLDGFTAAVGSSVDFTLEFDLRMAMTNPVGQSVYFLKPRGVRLVDNLQVATLSGQVTETLLLNNLCEPLATSDVTVATLYLYDQANLDFASMADIGGSEDYQPVAVTSLEFDSAQTQYTFEIGFVELGDYSLALSCQIQDDPEVDDDISFFAVQNVSLNDASQTVEVIFDVQ